MRGHVHLCIPSLKHDISCFTPSVSKRFTFKEGTAQWSREAHSVSTRVLFISAGWNHAHCPAQRTASWSIQSPWFLFYGTHSIISWDHNPSHSKSTCYIFDISLQGILGRLSHRKGDDWLCKGRFSLIGLRSLSMGPISMSPALNPRPDSQIACQVSCQWWHRKHSLLENAWSLTCCCCSVATLCLTLGDPMDCSPPGLLVPHYLPEFALVI